jgi:hypothetical protein
MEIGTLNEARRLLEALQKNPNPRFFVAGLNQTLAINGEEFEGELLGKVLTEVLQGTLAPNKTSPFLSVDTLAPQAGALALNARILRLVEIEMWNEADDAETVEARVNVAYPNGRGPEHPAYGMSLGGHQTTPSVVRKCVLSQNSVTAIRDWMQALAASGSYYFKDSVIAAEGMQDRRSLTLLRCDEIAWFKAEGDARLWVGWGDGYIDSLYFMFGGADAALAEIEAAVSRT